MHRRAPPELLAGGRVDAALVPVIAFQMLDGVRLVPGVCVGARERVKSVCLITKGADLADVKSVALDTSSQTSVALTKIIFREFLGFEPEWQAARPDVGEMLAAADAALLIGDPALELSLRGGRACVPLTLCQFGANTPDWVSFLRCG
jgi:chorismate dehydratase